MKNKYYPKEEGNLKNAVETSINFTKKIVPSYFEKKCPTLNKIFFRTIELFYLCLCFAILTMKRFFEKKKNGNIDKAAASDSNNNDNNDNKNLKTLKELENIKNE